MPVIANGFDGFSGGHTAIMLTAPSQIHPRHVPRWLLLRAPLPRISWKTVSLPRQVPHIGRRPHQRNEMAYVDLNIHAHQRHQGWKLDAWKKPLQRGANRAVIIQGGEWDQSDQRMSLEFGYLALQREQPISDGDPIQSYP